MTDAISSREAYIRACRDYCALLREERTAEEKHKTPRLEKDYLNKLVENAAHYVWEEMHSHFANKFRSERKPEDYAQAAHLRRHQATIIKRAVKSSDFRACVEERVFGNYEIVSKHCETLLSDPNPRELKDQAVRIGLEKLRDLAWPLWNRAGIVPPQKKPGEKGDNVTNLLVGGIAAAAATLTGLALVKMYRLGEELKQKQGEPGNTPMTQPAPSDAELGKPRIRPETFDAPDGTRIGRQLPENLRDAAAKGVKDLPPKPPSPQR